MMTTASSVSTLSAMLNSRKICRERRMAAMVTMVCTSSSMRSDESTHLISLTPAVLIFPRFPQ